MHEAKAFTVNVRAGRVEHHGSDAAAPALWPTRETAPDDAASRISRKDKKYEPDLAEFASDAVESGPARSRRPQQEETGFFTDTTLCIGCKACEVACKQWNQLPADGFHWTGNSYDNTVALSDTTWRHVAFMEQFDSAEPWAAG